MPAATPQAIQEKVVQLYQAGKTYSQITAETGVQGPVISGIIKKSGVPKRKASPSAVVPASPPATPPAPAMPAASPPPSSAASPSVVPAAQALADLQPPAPPKPKTAATSPLYRADCCSAQFRLDPGETLASVTVCPAGCGGTP